jgi:plasmid maintenance system killer protein
MSKETFYFPHDYEPTSDPKIQALLGEYGGMGYGVFWRVTEMLHSDENHKIPLKEFIFIAIAKQMLADAKQIQAMLQYSINVCELFESDGEYFWSNRVNENFVRRAEISEKRALAGSMGGKAKQMLSKNKQNVAKERKGKEITTSVKTIDRMYGLKKKTIL